MDVEQVDVERLGIACVSVLQHKPTALKRVAAVTRALREEARGGTQAWRVCRWWPASFCRPPLPAALPEKRGLYKNCARGG